MTLDQTVASLPHRFPGPGGACAVLRDGEVVLRHAWGFANAERRIPFTSRTLFRMCSITKQFTCALVLDQFPDPGALNPDIAARLPALTQPAPDAAALCHNQSGLRDYWAVAMLHGAPAESGFGDQEAAEVIRRTETLHFAPRTRYAYCNQNFRLLSDILEARTGRSFAELLRTRLFDPAGMSTAFLAADTSAMPDGTQGYEGTQSGGFRAAVNRLIWTGDAGLGASLDDMIAWERWIDAARDDPTSLYGRMSAPVAFADGTDAVYGYGLARRDKWNRRVVGHGGALRGWRSHRLYVASERLSVIVLFNHMADAQAAAFELLQACLAQPSPPEAAREPPPAWLGTYLEPETGLAVRIDAAAQGQVRLRFDRHPDMLDAQPGGDATSDAVALRLRDGGLWMERPTENLTTRLLPIAGTAPADVAGRYHCAELDAELTLEDAGGALFGAFSGFLGRGRMELLDHVAGDVWALPCPRALDHSPPGDWTLHVERGSDGRPERIRLGCWLARGLVYERMDR